MRVNFTPDKKTTDCIPHTNFNAARRVFIFSKVVLLWVLFLTTRPTLAQNFNIGQAALVENGSGAIPNVTGAAAVFVSGNYAYVVTTGNVLEILDITLPGRPLHKGIIHNGEDGAVIVDPRAVFVAGNYAYIACAPGALEIVDVSDPSNPFHKGILKNNLSNITSLYVYGNYAYLTSLTGTLKTIDIADPANPRLVSSYSTPFGSGNSTTGLFVSKIKNELYAFAVSRDGNTFQVINIQDPAKPVGVSPLITIYKPTGIFVSGYSAYISTAAARIWKIDISNPKNPLVKPSLLLRKSIAPAVTDTLNVAISSICVSGKYVYAGGVDFSKAGAGTLEVADTTMVRLGNVSFSNNLFYQNATNRPQFLAVKEGNAFVLGAGIEGVGIIDVSKPTAPFVKTVVANGSEGAVIADPRSVYVLNNYAYVASQRDKSLEIINVSDPTLPKHISNLSVSFTRNTNTDGPRCVFVLGKYAYLTTFASLEIVDVSNPNFPVWVGRLGDVTGTSLSEANAVVAFSRNGKTYAALTSKFTDAMVIIDVSNPFTPTIAANVKHAGGATGPYLDNPTHLYVLGANAYVISQNGDNKIQQKAGTITIAANSTQVTGTGTSFLSDFAVGNTVVSFTYSATKIGVVKSIQSNTSMTLSSPASAYKDALYANLTNSNAGTLQLFDISNPEAPVTKGFVKGVGSNINPKIGDFDGTYTGITGGNNITVASKGDSTYAYIADTYNRALAIVNVTNPNTPKVRKSITDLEGLCGTRGIALSGNYAIVPYQDIEGAFSLNSSGLEVIDVSDPLSPKHVALYKGIPVDGILINRPSSLSLSGNYAFVSNAGEYPNMAVMNLNTQSISSVAPFSPIDGPVGTSVTINGSNFDTSLKVSINGMNAKVTHVSATALTVTIPPYATIGKLVVKNGAQQISTEASFIVRPTSTNGTLPNPTGFTANWSDVGAKSYYLDVSTEANFASFVAGYANKNVSTTTSSPVTGLSAGTTYYYRVRSTDGTFTSGNSNVVTVTTLPSAPVAGSATQVTPSGFTANWTTSSGATGYILDVAYDANFTNFVVGFNNLTVAGSATNAQTVSGLNAYTKCYYRVRSANSSGSSSFSNVMNVTTLDLVPPAIAAPNAPNPSRITLGNTPTLNVIVTDNVAVTAVTLFYRGISESTFKTAAMQGQGATGGNYSITLQTDWYDSLGLEYYFKATDQAGNTSVNASAFIQLVTPSLSLPPLPTGTEESDYRIIAFPYQLATDNKVTTVYSGVPWNDHTKAAMWWWNPTVENGNGRYEQYGISNTLQIVEPGKGYWVITRTPIVPQLSNVTAPKYNQSNLFSMTLKPGWNEIGNPYPVPISWDEVIAHNQATNPGTLFSSLSLYDGNGYKEATGTTLLKAFEGGFVKNFLSSDIVIEIPFTGQTNSGGRTASIHADISQENWNLPLHIHQNGRTNQLGGFGMHRAAQAGVDRYDNFNPPSFLGIPEVRFTNAEFPDVSFSNDMVSSQDKYTWTFTPHGKQGSATQLTWNNELNVNSSQQLFLLDEELLTVTDMNRVNHYDFILTSKSSFRIFYGSNVTITSSQIVAGSPYPNPLMGEEKATINLALPESSNEYSIHLQIYDRQGNRIASSGQRLSAGIHPIELALPSSLAEGIYIYTLAVTNERTSSIHTGKIVKP